MSARIRISSTFACSILESSQVALLTSKISNTPCQALQNLINQQDRTYPTVQDIVAHAGRLWQTLDLNKVRQEIKEEDLNDIETLIDNTANSNAQRTPTDTQTSSQPKAHHALNNKTVTRIVKILAAEVTSLDFHRNRELSETSSFSKSTTICDDDCVGFLVGVVLLQLVQLMMMFLLFSGVVFDWGFRLGLS